MWCRDVVQRCGAGREDGGPGDDRVTVTKVTTTSTTVMVQIMSTVTGASTTSTRKTANEIT
jgi:hypothetical protein